MFIAEPQILLDRAQKSWDGFVKGAVAKYDELDKKISSTGQSFEKISGRIGKATQVSNQLLGAGEKLLAKYPGHLGEYEEGIKKALPSLKETAAQTGEWALAGATIGSVIPGVGTAVGAMVGATASIALSVWDWASGTSEAADETERAAKAQDDVYKAALKRWELIKKERDDKYAETAKDLASAFSAGLKEAGFGAEKVEKSLGNTRVELEKVVDAQQEWNDLIDALGEKPQVKEVITGLGRQKSAFDVALGSRSSEITQDTAPELMGPASVQMEDFDAGFDIDQHEKDLKEKFDKDIALYQDYASTITAITSALTDQLAENIATGDNLFAHMGEAAVAGVAQVLKQLSKMWGAEALGELAQGIAALANPAAAALTGETAAGHFAAAAAYGAAAAATGVGGALLGGAAKRHNTARNAPDSAPASGMGGDSGTKQLATIVVNFSSTVPATEREAQEAAAKVNSLLDKGARK